MLLSRTFAEMLTENSTMQRRCCRAEQRREAMLACNRTEKLISWKIERVGIERMRTQNDIAQSWHCAHSVLFSYNLWWLYTV